MYLDKMGIFLIFLGVFLFLLIVVALCFAIRNDIKYDKQIDVCFLQEPKTKECELFLYKYENRKKTNSTTSTVFMPMFIR